MKEYDFNASIKDILIKKVLNNISNEEVDILKNNKFAYTYLIMDFDIQHYKNDLNKALTQIDEMCKYFLDETDDTIGKLYINYPMMESFRDRDDFIDNTYNDKIIKICDIVDYKQVAGLSKLSSMHLSKYGLSGFNNIIKSNIDKACVKLFGLDEISYKKYKLCLSTLSIFDKQRNIMVNGYFYILNTSMYLIADYFGEKYFDKLLLNY